MTELEQSGRGSGGKLSVAIVARSLTAGAGGMERTAANLANHLAGQGHTVGVMFLERSAPGEIYTLRDDVVRYPFERPIGSLEDTVVRFGPDVIVYFYATAREAAAIVALCQTGIPVVLHEGSNPDRVIHANWAEAKGIAPDQARLERLATMAGCARIRFTLPQYRDSLPEGLRDMSVAFPNAFPPANPADIALRSEAGRKIFLNIGGLKRVKNVIAAVTAFAMIADDLPEWDFHIFSAESAARPVRPMLERFIAQRGLRSRVKIFPPTPDIGREYGRSHVHVIASKEEGLPNCVAEAARHALPSIGFACCAGTNAMIVDDHNGLLVECGADEVEALAKAMGRAARDEAARLRWGQTALDESHIYAPEHVFARWDALIEAAAADRMSVEERFHRRFCGGWQRLRAVQRASFHAAPWPAHPRSDFDDEPPGVSIVVTLFNKEEYIAETLGAIAASSHPEKEVIVVDDLSTDASADIAATICDQHGWRLIRHSSNLGLSEARNTGLDAATGEYVHFWDADDIHASEGIGQVLRAMHDSCADIGTGVATRDGKVLAHYADSQRDMPAVTYARMPESFATASSCFKIYRRAFLLENGLRFEPGLYMQDSEFNLRAFPLAERITMTSAILGEYRFSANSSGRKYHPARYLSAMRIADMTRDFYTNHGLQALEKHRQTHVLGKVFPMFVVRARRGYVPVDGAMTDDAMDFDFLSDLQERLTGMSEGLSSPKLCHPNVWLAYFTIREGYLNWVPDLLRKDLPKGFRPELLVATPAERPLIERLTDQMRNL